MTTSLPSPSLTLNRVAALQGCVQGGDGIGHQTTIAWQVMERSPVADFDGGPPNGVAFLLRDQDGGPRHEPQGVRRLLAARMERVPWATCRATAASLTVLKELTNASAKSGPRANRTRTFYLGSILLLPSELISCTAGGRARRLGHPYAPTHQRKPARRSGLSTGAGGTPTPRRGHP